MAREAFSQENGQHYDPLRAELPDYSQAILAIARAAGELGPEDSLIREDIDTEEAPPGSFWKNIVVPTGKSLVEKTGIVFTSTRSNHPEE